MAHGGNFGVAHYPPTLEPPFVTAPAPLKIGLKNVNNFEYFNNFKNEYLSKFQMAPYDWGFIDSMYMPKPNIRLQNDLEKYLKLPTPVYTMLDGERMSEIDAYYKVAQMHRAKLQDISGSVHPMKYYKQREYPFQCPPDPTSTYFKFPHYYTKYRDPIVYPLTLERSGRVPMLPMRALTGRYSPHSDISYKK